MLVVIGANGRTGIEFVREAERRGIPVRAVVRDDRDSRDLDKVIDISEIRYADSDHPAALLPVLDGAEAVISCINHRTAGPHSPPYDRQAGANIIRVASDLGIPTIVHLSVVGAYRWSPSKLNRESFKIDREVRVLKALPWSHIRISCYIDELIDGHVAPPDGGTPHPIKTSSRYAPVSRRDVAALVLDALDDLVPGRTQYIGGPEILSGTQVQQMIAPFRTQGGRRTQYPQLPPGDVSVHPDVTRVMIGRQGFDTLESALRGHDPRTEQADAAPVYKKGGPDRHPSDGGGDVAETWTPELRWVVHDQLSEDLGRQGLPSEGVHLDFSRVITPPDARTCKAHGGSFSTLHGVRVMAPDGTLLHEGNVDFLRDKLAEEFRCWWSGDGVPEAIWLRLDMGVRRRMVNDAHFLEDPQVQAFAGGHEVAS
jgi:uncharacterized protein YbjT (DUF2867 family)